jgi:hypothetical protein
MMILHSFRNKAVSTALCAAAVTILPLALGDTRPVSSRQDVSRLPAPAAGLYRDVTLFPRQMKYREIPWLLDLDEGIRLARKEKRPLLIWTSGDDPLERC